MKIKRIDLNHTTKGYVFTKITFVKKVGFFKKTNIEFIKDCYTWTDFCGGMVTNYCDSGESIDSDGWEVVKAFIETKKQSIEFN